MKYILCNQIKNENLFILVLGQFDFMWFLWNCNLVFAYTFNGSQFYGLHVIFRRMHWMDTAYNEWLILDVIKMDLPLCALHLLEHLHFPKLNEDTQKHEPK